MTALRTDIALGYRTLGFRPIPIVAGSKRAAVPWKRWQEETPTEREIVPWFSAGERDVALVTGRGIVVVDVDDPDVVDIALARCGETPMQCRTPSGGRHLYYAMRRGVRYGNAVRIRGTPIDLRCEGAYAVCPWSRSDWGVSYEWIHGPIPASELPPLNVSWLRERRPRRRVLPVASPCNPHTSIRRARRYLANIEGAIAGSRGHDRTFRVACVLAIKFGLSFADAWPLFLEWNEQCEPPWSEKELRHKLQDALKQRVR